ncbi:mitochondrial ribosomal protein L48 [Lycorma delicatula]|uniref:mitochondrial ribosomal protein L48 n=1 Tax=Lycorma delicatula TaxID=130591 RepID=UPI003F51797E
MAFKTLFSSVSKYMMKRCSVSKDLMSGRQLKSYSTKFDPPYLDAMRPKVPVYEVINVQIKGYDFALVESYQSLVHNIAKTMELDVADSWATPATTTKVNKFKPLSTVVDSEFNLTLYERNVQVLDLPSSTAAVLVELLHSCLPQGLTVTLHAHTDEHEDIRYVPAYELDELKSQLDSLGLTKKK